MKNVFFGAACIAALITGSSAKAEPLEAPLRLAQPPLWTGFHAGLNAGYGWGASNRIGVAAIPLDDSYAQIFDSEAAIAAAMVGGTFSRMTWGNTSLANTGTANINQNGFVGGAQVGYDHQWGSSLVVGIEADVQGAGIRGNGAYSGVAADAGSINFVQNGNNNTASITRTAVGVGEVAAGIDWLGTVRGRIGWLTNPAMLVFGTGGLAFGGVHASAVHWLGMQESAAANGPNIALTGPSTMVLPSFGGVGHYSDTRVGWTAGAGVEWMFMPNWSLKAEALYYDLGAITFTSSPVGVISSNGIGGFTNAPSTRVKYDGVIARAGVNYHLDWWSAPNGAK